MIITLSPELQAFVDEQVRTGKYASVEAAIAEAVRHWKQREEKVAWLRRELQIGLDELDRGEGTEWDVEEMKAMLREERPRT